MGGRLNLSPPRSTSYGESGFSMRLSFTCTISVFFGVQFWTAWTNRQRKIKTIRSFKTVKKRRFHPQRQSQQQLMTPIKEIPEVLIVLRLAESAGFFELQNSLHSIRILTPNTTKTKQPTTITVMIPVTRTRARPCPGGLSGNFRWCQWRQH